MGFKSQDPNITNPLLTVSGTFTTLRPDKDNVLKRCAEPFDRILNRPSSISEDAIHRLSQVFVHTSLTDLPNRQENAEATDLLSNCKSPAPNAKQAEVYNVCSKPKAMKLTELLQTM